MFVRSRILLVLALLVTGLLLPATILPAGPARAAACADAQTNPVLAGGFEVDGNLCSNTSGSTGPPEWDAVAGQPIASDPRAQADGTAFSGTSEDGWPWSVAETSGSNPSGNADITQVFGYSQVSNDHVYAYVGWERAAIQGTAGFFVELNQKPNLRGPVPDRTDGDLRLRFIQQGNTLLTLDAAYLWTSTGPTSGTWDAIPVGPYQARVNAGTVSNLPGLTPDPMPAGTFAEAAVDLTGLFAGFDRARAGQVLTIRQGRTAHRFVVTGTHTYVRGTRLPQGYFATTGPHRLVLISCADRVVHPDGRFHYTHALVVEARPVR